MKIKNIILAVIYFIISISCRSYNNNAIEENFKVNVFYKCVSEGVDNKQFDSILLSKDASFSYDGIMGNDFYKIDSLGIQESKKIPFTPIEDLGKKKLIFNHCLKFYKSRELHILSKKYYKNKL